MAAPGEWLQPGECARVQAVAYSSCADRSRVSRLFDSHRNATRVSPGWQKSRVITGAACDEHLHVLLAIGNRHCRRVATLEAFRPAGFQESDGRFVQIVERHPGTLEERSFDVSFRKSGNTEYGRLLGAEHD